MSFDYFNSAANNKRIQPTAQQTQAFKECWNQINPAGEDKFHGKQVITYMKQLGLKQFQIRQIWKIANANSDEYLDEQEMFIAIRLIEYAKNGLQINQQNLAFPAPKKGKVNSFQQRLPKNMLIPDQDIINSFHNKWLTLQHKSSGLAKGSQIKRRYSNQASKDVLSQIWAMCSQTVKGHLTKGQTLLFEHFLSLKKQNVSVNSLPQQSKQLIGQIDYENAYKIKAYSTQLEIQKQNYLKASNPQINVEQIDKQVDSNNDQIEYLKNQIIQMKQNQTSNINKACQTIQRLKNIIEVQNAQIKELKTTIVDRGQLEVKRVQFVQVCEYTVQENQYPQHNMKKKQTPLSTNTQMPSQKTIEHYSHESPYSAQSNIRRSQQSQPKQIIQLRQKTIRLIMQKTPMMPHDQRLLERRISQMGFEQLKNQYNQLQNRYKVQRQPTEMNVSMASVQKLEIIKNVFGNISLDQNQL